MADSISISLKMIPSEEEMLTNLLAWYALSQRDRRSFEFNFNWYPYARQQCQELADFLAPIYGAQITLHVVCQVVAALSPGKRWSINIQDAELAIHAYYATTCTDGRMSFLSFLGFQVGYTWENTINAFSCLDGVDIPEERVKTYNFAHNLEFPWDEDFCTVDQHMIHILCDTRLKGAIGHGSHYEKLPRVVRKCANALGILANQLQAAVWGFRVDSFEAGYSVGSLYEMMGSFVMVESAV